MSAGFHRDPNLLGEKVSVFDQEMRRRLWASMIELELQASVDRGMPSASAGVPSDSATILNVNDEDLTGEGDSLPTPKPWDEYTAGSFLHISRASFSIRVSLNSLVNDLSTSLRYDEVLNYEEMVTIRGFLHGLKWDKPKTSIKCPRWREHYLIFNFDSF
jgi:hypothetical protein